MIYIDSNVPMYLVGAEHPHKRRVIELTTQLLSAHEVLVTSAETFQEVIHRYSALKDQVHLNAAYEALEAMASTVSDVTKSDVDGARTLAARYPELSSRDCLHVSVMQRLGCSRIWSFDSGFDSVASLQRIA